MIIFHNPGLMPLEAIRLMGASVKTEGAFGRFGTGFKYAIASILRGGGSIRVWRGKQELCFKTQTVDMKGKAFEEVMLEGWNATAQQSLGFTTALGKDWEPWMALRELACNARDEGGDFKLTDMPAVPECFSAKDDETVIVVEWEAMDAAMADGSVFAPAGEPLLEERGVRVHPGPSDYLYHRGVRVWKLPKPAVFTYDITKAVDLTEDRTVKYGFCVLGDVRGMILETEDRAIIAAATTAEKGTWEAGFDWSGKDWHAPEPGATWLDEVAAARERRATSYDTEVSSSASDVLLRHRAFKEVNHSSSWSTFEGQAHSLNYASDVLDDLGMGLGSDRDDQVPVYITKMLPGDALSAVNGGRVYIAERLLDERTSVIVRELLKRQLELKSGGDHDALLEFAVDRFFDFAMRHDYALRRDHDLAQEEAEAGANDVSVSDQALDEQPAPAPAPAPLDDLNDDMPF